MNYRKLRIPRQSCRKTLTPLTEPIGEVHFEKLGYQFTRNGDDCRIPAKPSLGSSLKLMMKEQFFGDITIFISEEEFQCNLLSLRLYCDFFRELEHGLHVIHLFPENVFSDAFELICDWILYPEVDIPENYTVDVYVTAEYLGIEELKQICWAYFESDYVKDEQAFVIYTEAKKRKCFTLMRFMLTRISKFFLTLVSSKQFVEFSITDVLLFLQSNTIAVNSEMEVLLAGLRWLNYDWAGRQQYVVSVIGSVRFLLMPAIELLELNREYKAVAFDRAVMASALGDTQVKQLIKDAVENLVISFWKTKELCASTLQRYLEEGNAIARVWIADPLKLHYRATSIYDAYTQFHLYLDALRSLERDYYANLVIAQLTTPTYLVNLQNIPSDYIPTVSESASSSSSRGT